MDNSYADDDARARRFLAIVTTLFVLGLLCCSARIFSRIFPSNQLNASDYVNLSSVAVMIVAYSLFVASIHEGFGRNKQSLKHESIVNILRLLFFLKLIGNWGSTLSRLTIILQLLPFSASTAWKAVLWVIAALEVASLIAMTLHWFLQAKPLSANWDGSGYKGGIVFAYVFTAASVMGDLWCSIIPLFLIWDLNRSILERCLLSVLIALGICAAGAMTTTLVLLKSLRHSHAAFRKYFAIYTWCLVEETTLIVASSAPLLKAPIERVLYRWGFPKFHNIPRELGSYQPNRVPRKPRWHIAWIGRKLHGNPPQYQNNTAAPKDPSYDSNSQPHDTINSISDVGPSSTRAAGSVQMEDPERSDRLP